MVNFLPMPRMLVILDDSLQRGRKKKKKQVVDILNQVKNYSTKVSSQILSKKIDEKIFESCGLDEILEKDFDKISNEEPEGFDKKVVDLIKRAVGAKFETDLGLQKNMDSLKTAQYNFNLGRIIDNEIEKCYSDEQREYVIETAIKKRKQEKEEMETGMKEEKVKKTFETRSDKLKKSIGKGLKEMRQESKELFDSSEKKGEGAMDIQFEATEEEEDHDFFKDERNELEKAFLQEKTLDRIKAGKMRKRSNKSEKQRGKRTKLMKYFSRGNMKKT